jgi:hypothetical protein
MKRIYPVFISIPGPTGFGGASVNGYIGPTGDNGIITLFGATGMRGPTGDRGPAGNTGNIGLTGLLGPTGNRGPLGMTGDLGNTGRTGRTGSRGPTGLRGPAGNTGITGDRGITGMIGDQGIVGHFGSTGDNGPKGLTGRIGLTGPIGYMGPTGTIVNFGAIGMTGTIGSTGFTGPEGNTGTTGATGYPGYRGPTGNQGNIGGIGPNGKNGPTGTTGVVGPAGPDGNTGFIGYLGHIGPTGKNGTIGGIGITGKTGPSGFGAAGDTGPSGLQGNTGNTGNTGIRGSQGPTGFNSVTGATGPASSSATGPTGPNIILGTTGINGLTGINSSVTLQPFIVYSKIDNYININGSLNYNGTFASLFTSSLLTLSIPINKTQLGLTPSTQINESKSVGLYDLSIYYASGDNFSIDGRMRFQNTTSTTTTLLFDLAKPIATGGTLGQLTFKAYAQTEQIVPLLAPFGSSGTGPASFEPGLSISQGFGSFIPSDSNIAVGPSQIISTTNVSLAINNKSSPFIQIVGPTNIYTFWGANVVPNVGAFGSGDNIFDPWIVYDQFASKFVFTTVRNDSRAANPVNYKAYVLMAISKTSTPTTLTSIDWDYYIYDRTQNVGVNPTFPDYQKLGYDDVAYYISENNFTITNETYINSRVFALRKSNLNIPIDTGITYPCIPVQSYESTSNAFYCITHQSPNIFITAINKITNLSVSINSVTVPGTWNAPALMAQPNQSYLKLDNESNEQCAVLRRNVTDRIWTTINASTPTAVDSYGNLKGIVVWAEINVNNWPVSGSASLAQSQIKIADGNDSISYGHINVDSLNNMSMGCAIVSINRNPGLACFSRLATDPLNTTRSVTPLRPGLDSYQVTFGGSARFFDYSGACIDPTDNRTFWTFGQYATIGPFTVSPNFGGWSTTATGYILDNTSPYVPMALTSNIENIEGVEILKENLRFNIPKCSIYKL